MSAEFLAIGAGLLWFLDKAAGGIIGRRIDRLLFPDSSKPYAERLAEKLDELEAEHHALVALCERVVEDRNRYHFLYLLALRQKAS